MNTVACTGEISGSDISLYRSKYDRFCDRFRCDQHRLTNLQMDMDILINEMSYLQEQIRIMDHTLHPAMEPHEK